MNSSHMDSDLFRQIADELFPTAELVDLRGWGESLLLSNIVELIRYTRGFGCDIRFVTNLSFRRDEVLASLAENNCYLEVSLDSAEDDILPRLRSGASLAHIQRNLKLLVGQYNALHGNSNRIILYCTVQRPALASLESLIAFAADVGISEVRLARVSTTKPHLSLNGCDEKVTAALQSVQLAAKSHGIQVVLATHFEGLPECEPGKPACIRPWSFASINVEGFVGFCDHLIGPFARKYLMGDLKVSKFEETWNSDQWQGLRLEHLQERREDAALFSHCDWCYRKRFIDFEDQFLPELAKSKVLLSDGLGDGYAY